MSPLAIDAAAIGVGAFCGALSRYQVGRITGEIIAENPARLGGLTNWHTAGINILGSFILGGVSQATTTTWPSGLTPRMKLLLGTGFCGSFTTFSTYSVDVVNWIAHGQISTAMKYVALNNVGGILAAATGMAVVKSIKLK
mmetsp:Transcript_12215/g.17912  ORF Transcript_12215/g.17912 Transcript_12215/m.17912 type:complete len:141 (-) Transcript_12215:846-1268(-)